MKTAQQVSARPDRGSGLLLLRHDTERARGAVRAVTQGGCGEQAWGAAGTSPQAAGVEHGAAAVGPLLAARYVLPVPQPAPACHRRPCLRDLPVVPTYPDGEQILASREEPVAGAEIITAPAQVSRGSIARACCGLWGPCPDSVALRSVAWHGWAAPGMRGASRALPRPWECRSGHSSRQQPGRESRPWSQPMGLGSLGQRVRAALGLG